MATLKHRRRRQLQRQRRHARRVQEELEAGRQWKARGGLMGFLKVRYPDGRDLTYSSATATRPTFEKAGKPWQMS